MDQSQFEKYRSAITLSDMEYFVFPELMYSLVSANIMSPVVRRWRQLDCFGKFPGKKSTEETISITKCAKVTSRLSCSHLIEMIIRRVL